MCNRPYTPALRLHTCSRVHTSHLRRAQRIQNLSRLEMYDMRPRGSQSDVRSRLRKCRPYVPRPSLGHTRTHARKELRLAWHLKQVAFNDGNPFLREGHIAICWRCTHPTAL